MNIQVVYHSRTGNTKIIAEAIAEEMGVTAVPVDQAEIREPVDLIFLGDGMYYGRISDVMKIFIDSLDNIRTRSAATFSTSGGSWWFGTAGLKKRLKERGITVLEESFHCHGSAFGIAFTSHPDETDIENARKFAKRVNACLNPDIS